MLIRSALREADRVGVRAAVGVVFALAERARQEEGAERFWWERAILVSSADLALDLGLPVGEVRTGTELLLSSGVLRVESGGTLLLDPDVLCEQPLLAAVDWQAVRDRVGERGRLGPCLATLRELARMAIDRKGVPGVVTQLPDVVEATLYGRSAVAQALTDLEQAGLVVRLAPGSKKGLQVSLAPAAFGAPGPSVAGRSTPNGIPAPQTSTGFVLDIGGSTLSVPAGAHASVELDPTGRPVVRLQLPPP
jgi:hypothetical protein